jgi:hypothetical protein
MRAVIIVSDAGYWAFLLPLLKMQVTFKKIPLVNNANLILCSKTRYFI